MRRSTLAVAPALSAALLLAAIPCGPAFAANAFPSAVGFGAAAQGGRGGAVIPVTSLADSGPGTLRACLTASGARTCVFRVAGTINLQSQISVDYPNLTIAGQTAPGGGVAVKVNANSSTCATPIRLRGGAGDTVIRHVRFRPGPCAANPSATDGFLVDRSDFVIFDHVSFSWAPDENLNVYRSATNITVQYSIMAEGLLSHSKGALICGDENGCERVTLYRNLIVDNKDRNPELTGKDGGGQIDVIDNVLHNGGSAFLEVKKVFDAGSRLWPDVNFLGNTCRKGPKTTSAAACVRYEDLSGTAGASIIHAPAASNAVIGTVTYLATTGATMSPVPVGTLSVTASAPATAMSAVLASAGAWPRDSADQRVVGHAQNGTGGFITTPADVGGWPALASGTPYQDVDGDGMDDAWETGRGLNPGNAADRNADPDGDGYTNLDDWLEQRHLDVTPP